MDIAVFGLGKLGLPLAALLSSKGHSIVGVDPNEYNRLAANGSAPLWEEPSLEQLLSQNRDRITTTDDPDRAVSETSMAMVIVPTPSDSSGAFSNDYVLKAIEQIGTSLNGVTRPYDVVVVSTVMPGSMGGAIRERLENSSQRSIGPEFGLLYSPLFVALGAVIKKVCSSDLVLIGEEETHSSAGSRLIDVLSSIQSESNHREIHRLPWAGAELVKIGINSFVTTKIAFANWIAQITEQYDAEPDQVLAAIGTDSRIGSEYLSFGMPFGGPCFPRDNLALALVGEQLGLSGSLPRATQELNKNYQDCLYQSVVTRAAGGKVAVLGLAYKPGTAITEESAGLCLARALFENGHDVIVHDPIVIQDEINQVDTVKAAVNDAKVVVVATQAYERIEVNSKSVVVNPWGIKIDQFFEGTEK